MYFRRSCKNWDCHNFQLEKPLCVWQEESLRGFSKVVTIRFATHPRFRIALDSR